MKVLIVDNPTNRKKLLETMVTKSTTRLMRIDNFFYRIVNCMVRIVCNLFSALYFKTMPVQCSLKWLLNQYFWCFLVMTLVNGFLFVLGGAFFGFG